MKNHKIIQSVLMLVPAGVVGIACAFGLVMHPVNIVAPDNAAAVSQTSDEASETSFVSESAEPETLGDEQTSLTDTSDTSKAESSRTSSSKPTKESSAASEAESSKTQEKLTQQSSQRVESSQSSKGESSKASGISVPQAQTSEQQESSRSATQQSSSPKPQTETSKPQTAQSSQREQEPSKTEVSRPAETSRQESRQPSSKPTQESSAAPTEISEVSEETSNIPEVPVGKYIDGTYKATSEVDGFDEEGFLYDLEVTVTVSGGEITSITGKIKNDRSEDPSSNEAYVRRAVKKLSDVIIPNQGTSGVDVISNATYSSNAVLKAVSEALAQAER